MTGDASLVVTSGDRTIVAVVDGLGHGPPAAEAAQRAVAAIVEHATEAVEPLVLRCHQALAATRGAAMALAAVDGLGTMDWIAVGNVEAAVVREVNQRYARRAETVFHVAGVVGHQLPTLHVRTTTIGVGDLLVMASDGVASAFLDDEEPCRSPQQHVAHLLSRYGKESDDALVLVAAFGAEAMPAPNPGVC
jgi:hypothetical protein